MRVYGAQRLTKRLQRLAEFERISRDEHLGVSRIYSRSAITRVRVQILRVGQKGSMCIIAEPSEVLGVAKQVEITLY